MKTNYAFIAVLDYADDGINVCFPDLPGCFTCADAGDTEVALKNAKEALGLHLFGMEQDNEPIPEATPITNITLEKNQIPVLIDVFMPAIRATAKTAFVKKTLSLPAWLAAMADEKKVNCSKVFQEALKSFFGLA
jgi:predicted RNase H-like HicB family nuclease